MQSSDLHYAAQAWVLAGGNLLTFAHLIKLPGLAGEVITMWLRGRTPVRQPLRSTHACRQFLLGSDYESLIGVRPGLARASAARPLAGSSPSAADGRLAALKGPAQPAALQRINETRPHRARPSFEASFQ
jgi:hypothetical protein